MRTYSLTYILIILPVLFVFAQEKIIGKVDYFMTVTHPDGIMFANHYTLYFDNEISFFIKKSHAKKINNDTENDMVNISGDQVSHTMVKNNLPMPFYYTNIKDQELIFREDIVQTLYLVQDRIESIPWKLLVSKKK